MYLKHTLCTLRGKQEVKCVSISSPQCDRDVLSALTHTHTHTHTKSPHKA